MIKCSPKKCAFCNQGVCVNRNIKIEGLFARSKKGTFCLSFKNEDDLNSIIPSISSNDNKLIRCDANYCKHNKRKRCIFYGK